MSECLPPLLPHLAERGPLTKLLCGYLASELPAPARLCSQCCRYWSTQPQLGFHGARGGELTLMLAHLAISSPRRYF